MYMRNTLPQLNLIFPMYWYPTRDLYIVIHFYYYCIYVLRASLVQSPTFTLQVQFH
jgi:hypothetical protein